MTYYDCQEKYGQGTVLTQRREFAALFSWVKGNFIDVEMIDCSFEGKLGAQWDQFNG